MRAMKTPTLFAAVTGVAAVPAAADAAELTVSVEIPRLSVAEYHRPYVALWIERPDETAVKTLAVWYDTKLAKGEGATWLKDMRQWWRKSGRDLQMPVDGVSAATRAPGEHVFGLGGAKALAALPAGSYQLVVEAARENGGREVLRAPFDWPVKAAKTVKLQGEHELGAVALELKP